MADSRLAGCMSLIHTTSVPPFLNSLSETITAQLDFVSVIEKQPQLVIIKNRKDFDLIDDNKTGIVLGLQKMPEISRRGDVEQLKQAGIVISGLAYGDDNKFAGGQKNPSSGLTDAGKRLIEWMAEAGMIIDLAHISRAAAGDIINYSPPEAKIICSHTGVFEVCGNNRNLPGDIIAALAKRGGFTGIFAMSRYLNPDDRSLLPFMAHLRQAYDFGGSDGLAIGSDVIYKRRDVEDWKKTFEWMKQNLDADDSLGISWPEYPLELNESAPEIIGCLARVISKNFPPDMVTKICGANFYNYILNNI